MSDVQNRISSLRQLLEKENLFAWVSITSDPHASEYLPPHWADREWLSGFTGSAGTLIVTQHDALLWTDSRYWTQAAGQLEGSGITLMKDGAPGVEGWDQWLSRHAPDGSSVGINGRSLSVRTADRLTGLLTPKGISLREDLDLPSQIWNDRPAMPSSTVFAHTLAPESRQSKLSRLVAQLASLGADSFMTSALDEIGWLTNLRASDVDYNPVFLSHFLLCRGKPMLFIDEARLPADLKAALLSDGFEVRSYAAFADAIASLPENASLLFDPAVTTDYFRNRIPKQFRVTEGLSPLALFKTRKTPEEIRLIDEAMIEDGAALCRFYAWLESALASGATVTEMDVVRRLHDERAKGRGYVSESFGTIAAVGANAALPHYEPSAEHNAVLEGDTVLLIDSGAQYESGTTDITRVTPIHRPDDSIRRDYTAVLRSHLHLLDAYFPEGAYASQLDTFARAPLWEVDADFGHGTGHGVGFFMNVHERPYSISPRSLPSEATKTVEGIVVSDEPGLYREGRWGIRIENLITPVPQASSEFGRFMTFRPLTLCPIDTRLIYPRMMKSDEIAKLNDYHRLVREKLKDRVSGEALTWLLERTEVF